MRRMIETRRAARKATGAAAALLAVAALGACGGAKDSTAENSAEALRDAADQSTPEARDILMNEAERIEDRNVQLPPGAPGSPVQDAMQRAGNAQVTDAPPPLQARPHRPGDPGPPPKTHPPQ